MNYKAFEGKDWGTNQIFIAGGPSILAEMKPTEIHLKRDGDKDDGPSLAIVMDGVIFLSPARVFGQISMKMLNEGLEDIGYQLVKIKP